MLKAFLSYSSKQKGYVEVIANDLGKSKIIYDKWSFRKNHKGIKWKRI
jgi:hypothetical protein